MPKAGVTLKLLWKEYRDKCRQNGSMSYGYTRFCNGYGEHVIAHNLTNHLSHKPGIVTEVDWSGSTMHFFRIPNKKACKKGIRTRYIRLPDLLMEREDALEEKQGIVKLLKEYSNFKLLILDEWLIQIPTEEEQHFLFELIERRYDEGSTIFCSQYREEEWHSRLGGGILADSILDRVVHKTTKFYAGDINMREYLSKRNP